MSYETFIAAKSETPRFTGCESALPLADHLFPHQRDLVAWALRKGRSAIFADTGLGKTAMQIEWARHVSQHGRVLILAPLAVTTQTEREGARWGVDVRAADDDDGSPIIVTNYEKMHKFDPAEFAGVVLDESSILKNYTGKTRNALIGAFSNTPYRLACTATPAPNDHTELGNHSEFLGVKSRVEMLAEYFVHDGGSTQDWRVKGHAVDPFWRWVCSWGAMVRRPSDLGHEDGGYDLPPLNMRDHVIQTDATDGWSSGMLFSQQATSLNDQRRVRRGTLEDRVRIAAELAADGEPWIFWCEYNAESEAIARAIPGAVEVAGSDDAATKADRMIGFAEGRYRVLVTKPKIAGFGMNWQHCNRMCFAGATHSYEQTYQAIRRCWRFGQIRPVDVHILRADTEATVVANLMRKERDAAKMADEMTERIRETLQSEVLSASREWNEYKPDRAMTIPAWI